MTRARFLLSIVFMAVTQLAGAQALRIVFEDALFGSLQGGIFATSVMALERDVTVEHFRWGAGVGILYGVGTGIYDLSQAAGTDSYYLESTFVKARSTAAITLMDTGYGAGTGALLGLSYALIANSRVDEGLLTGYGAGVWAGFAFGLVDAFFLARSSDMPFSDSKSDFFSSLPRKGELRIQGPRPTFLFQPTETGFAARPALMAAGARFHF